MDGGQYRASQPADRRVINRAEPTSRPPETPQVAREEPASTYRADPPSPRVTKTKKSWKRRLIPPFIGIILIVIVAALGWSAWSNAQSAATAIDGSKYQAVFFTNGQVYFGKLKAFNTDSMKLSDIYYLQTQSTNADSNNPQQTATDQSSVQLIKLGNEVHGPEDEMILSKSQILFYENLKADGKVAQSIANYKAPSK